MSLPWVAFLAVLAVGFAWAVSWWLAKLGCKPPPPHTCLFRAELGWRWLECSSRGCPSWQGWPRSAPEGAVGLRDWAEAAGVASWQDGRSTGFLEALERAGE